ncbi:ATP-binding protein [Actinoplanes sp. NPDC051346]|uniref:ATP-binding protein n=1 Tax=Actinoplanes sp. NPDC051346 TaxID=3155048 RepID=UPI00341DFBA8
MADPVFEPSVVAGPDSLTYHEPGDLRAVRAFVAARAAALGLADTRTELLVLAVSELATNTLQHTAGSGRVRVFARPGVIVCDVVDQGPMREWGRRMPAADAVGGRGLAIVAQVCDEVETAAVEDGTRVRIRLRL